MLPSMPILFTRDSQDAFGNKIEPSTSFFGQPNVPFTIIKPSPQPPEPMPPPPAKTAPKETKAKGSGKKKETIQEELPKPDENNQDNAIATSYFSRVQAKFASNRVPNNKFVQFKDILKSFDPTKENPTDLFKKIQDLFGEYQKEIADEFILFLTAGQAAQIGRLMDQFMLLQLNDFIKLLQASFARKPTMLRKILRAINNSLNSSSLDEMRGKVLPHLRSCPRLAAAYRALFPDERPPDSVYENNTDKLHESFLTGGDRGYDVWAFQEKSEAEHRRRHIDKDSLDTVYLQGRVFLQHGRNLRPARVAFPFSKEPYRGHGRRLAPAHAHPSPPPSDDDARKKNPPKRPRKPRTKPAKDVNDNTKTHKKKPLPKRKEKTEKIKRKKEDKVKQVKDADKKAKSAVDWTRDEDKTMLQMLKGETVSDQVFGRINEKLPHRSVGEIKDRFFHVMTLLQQMAEVT